MPVERRKRNKGIIAGLDVGTTKVCTIAGELDEGGITIQSICCNKSTGLRKGVVVDIDNTVKSIKSTIEESEKQMGTVIKEVYVGISGSHIKTISGYGAVGIKGREVTPEDVENAIDSASAVNIPLDREILHVFPNDFILDRHGGIKDPVGMIGNRLEVNATIVTGSVTPIHNLIKCCENAGLEIIEIILHPFASAEAILKPDEKVIGIALVDIGGGTTDISVYKDGWMRHTAVLGIGGNHFTNDISLCLNLPFNEAERVKKAYGSVLLSEAEGASNIEVLTIDGQRREIPRKYITEIIEPRAEELIELIKQEIQSLQNSGISVSGVVFTGGSSMLAKLDRFAEAIISMPVRVGYPELKPVSFPVRKNPASHLKLNCIEGLEEYSNPMYSAGIGLVLYAAESLFSDEKHIASRRNFSGAFNKMTGWFKNIKKKIGGRHV